MNFPETTELENKIENINYYELKARIDQAPIQSERDFWFAIYDRAIQLRQKKIINENNFVI
ncbi:hypothetical protein PT285_11215 [Lactobacillus sp. ESL0791]|uniref:hypothetical protein n=1 Tax=Lactobacillus sp. ESL0791 TaxID=2983234 RepID=UPI0023F65F0B|nr:hypothetical protein [Lactobacillus sp. ESL0791]MDF7639971.1 hypothetical protein [Lactobacillus sp. ESL0791]